MKQLLITILCLWSAACMAQSPSGVDSTYLLPANNRTPMNAKWYDFGQYISNGKTLSTRGKFFVYDSAFLKGRAYYNILPDASDSGSQIANTEWVKRRLASYGPGRDTITFHEPDSVATFNAQSFGVYNKAFYASMVSNDSVYFKVLGNWVFQFKLSSGVTGWGLTGNAGTTAGTNFIGTTDGQDVVVKRNSALAGRIGTSSTSLGVGSLASNSGVNNTAFGANALNSNTTGVSNTALGSGALNQSVGNNNIGIGKDVGFNLVGGSNNVLIGTNIITTLPSTTNSNTAIGHNSLQTTTTGDSNTVVGYGAFITNTTGKRNTAIGANAVGAAVTTSSSIALGFNASATSNQFAVSDSITSFKIKNLPSGVGTKAVRFNPSTGFFSYADTSSGGGGSTLFGLTGTNTATGDVTGDLDGHDLAVSNGKLWSGPIGNGTFLAPFNLIGRQNSGLYSLYDEPVATWDDSLSLFRYGNSAMVVSSGNVGIGTTTPTKTFQIGQDNDVDGTFHQTVGTTNDANSIYANEFSSNIFRINSNDYYFLFDENNNGYQVGIGTNVPTAQLHTTGSVRFENYGAGAATFDASGNITSVSDERLKKNIIPYYYGLSAVKKLNPIQYQWNGLGKEKHDTTGYYAGFSAQNVKANLPLSTGTNKDGYLSLQDRAILAAAINAIKELSAKVDEQAKEIKKLKTNKTITHKRK